LRLSLRPRPSGGPVEAGTFLDPVPGPPGPVALGRAAPANGEASFRAFETAVAEAREGRLEAVVTAPISKAAWALAGRPYRGTRTILKDSIPAPS